MAKLNFRSYNFLHGDVFKDSKNLRAYLHRSDHQIRVLDSYKIFFSPFLQHLQHRVCRRDHTLSIQIRYHLKINMFTPFCHVLIYIKSVKVEKFLKGSLNSIPSPSPSMKIQIMGRKVCLMCKGKTLLGVVNKLLKTKSLLTSPSNVLPYYLK